MNGKTTTPEINDNVPNENKIYHALNERTATEIGFRRDNGGKWHAPTSYMLDHGPDIFAEAPDFCGEESSSLYLWLIEQHGGSNVILDNERLEGGKDIWTAAMIFDGENIVGTGDTLGEALCYLVLLRSAHQEMFGGSR